MSWKRAEERKKRLIKLYNKTKNHYGRGAWYDEDNDRYYRYSLNNGRSYSYYKFCKNYSNRLIRRRMLDENIDRTTCKKQFDLWWSVF